MDVPKVPPLSAVAQVAEVLGSPGLNIQNDGGYIVSHKGRYDQGVQNLNGGRFDSHGDDFG